MALWKIGSVTNMGAKTFLKYEEIDCATSKKEISVLLFCGNEKVSYQSIAIKILTGYRR